MAAVAVGMAASAACRAMPPAADAPVTFARDVAPILMEHIAGCHHPRGPAPFSVLEYETVQARAAAIERATRTRAMPPWLPEPGYGVFAGVRRLTDAQLDTIRRWVEAGAPEGRPSDLPAAPRTAEGWQLGVPDLVVSMPEPFRLEPGPADVFRNFVIPVPVTRTRFVKTIEIRPGNPRFVHHALMAVDEMRSSRRLDEADPGAGFGGMGMGDAHMPDGSLLGWTPGMVPFPGVAGMAWRLRPRTDLVLQLHMLPVDTAQTVEAEVGFHFADVPEAGDPAYVLILDADEQLDIPAGESDFVVTDEFELPVDVDVLVAYPHAHYLGKRLDAWATRPDGSTRWLIRIDDWDFMWQDVYRYADPVSLPAGTTVRMRWSFDNSAGNPHQRNVPPRRVTAGNRSSDEMAHLQLQMRVRSDADRARLQETHYVHMLEQTPRSASLLYAIGGALRDQGRFAEAAARYEAALAENPAYVAAYVNLGAVLLVLGRPDDAIDRLRTAVALDPEAVGARYNLGIAFATRGALEAAADQYREAVRLVPDYAEAHNNLGQVLAGLGRPVEAIEHLRTAARLMPDAGAIRNNLGQVLGAQGALDEAIAQFEEARRLRPDWADAHANLGTALLMQGRRAAAAGSFRRALELAPGHPQAREGLRVAGAPPARE